MPQYVDVIIIGAGISGLTIASNLQAKHKDVIILEASAHIGGRCWAKNGIDVGASWLHSCEGTKKYEDIADFSMCKHKCCDTTIDPDVDVVYGIPPSVLGEYAAIYNQYIKSPRTAKTYKAFEQTLTSHKNSSMLKDVLKYHRAKLWFQEPQGSRLDSNTYSIDAMPYDTMYNTFVAPLIPALRCNIKTHTPVKSITRTSNDMFEVHTTRGSYRCKNVVYTGTFPAIINIDIPYNIISASLRNRMQQTKYIHVLKVVWAVDKKSEARITKLFASRRQMHVPTLPWTLMLHEKPGYLYTFAAGPAYASIQSASITKWKKDLEQTLGINITDHMYVDYNKNKYTQTSYASVTPFTANVHKQLMNPSPGFYMSGDAIVPPENFKKWEWCIGTVTHCIHTANSVSKLLLRRTL